MTRHETAQERARRHKANPYRAAQIAPSHPMPPVVCVTEGCGHPRLRHLPRCMDCDCNSYREASADG